MGQLTVEHQLLPRGHGPATPSGGRARPSFRGGRRCGKRGRGSVLLPGRSSAAGAGSLDVFGAPLTPGLLRAAEDGHRDPRLPGPAKEAMRDSAVSLRTTR